jgi:phosphoglycolate phosphatase-like HAD superfamily hydrolase
MLEAKEYQGQRVVTFRDIDAVHQRPEGTAGRNFREHHHYFVCGEDFFRVAGDELSRLKQATNFVGSNAKELILITESGYLILAKSFIDDLAWQVQRMLVKSYFRAKGQAEEKQLSPPGTTADILKENILTGKAFAEAMGLDEHQVLIAAIAKTERQTGDDLQDFRHLLTSAPNARQIEPRYKGRSRGENKLSPERLAVLEALSNAGGPLTPKQVAIITGRGRNAAQKLLIKLKEAGAVDIVRYGQYVLKESQVPVKQ